MAQNAVVLGDTRLVDTNRLLELNLEDPHGDERHAG